MPRGHALGITFQLPELDKVSESKKQLQDRLDVYMGGKVAEELIYGPENVTTGASSDIAGATQIAYMMVTSAGMSPLLGNIDLSSDYGKLSSETKGKIEDEVRRIIDESYVRAKKLLTDNREKLERLALALVEYETLDRKEMETVVYGGTLKGKKVRGDAKVPILLPDFKVGVVDEVKGKYGLVDTRNRRKPDDDGGDEDDDDESGDGGVGMEITEEKKGVGKEELLKKFKNR